jgi:hypothetical protein
VSAAAETRRRAPTARSLRGGATLEVQVKGTGANSGGTLGRVDVFVPVGTKSNSAQRSNLEPQSSAVAFCQEVGTLC